MKNIYSQTFTKNAKMYSLILNKGYLELCLSRPRHYGFFSFYWVKCQQQQRTDWIRLASESEIRTYFTFLIKFLSNGQPGTVNFIISDGQRSSFLIVKNIHPAFIILFNWPLFYAMEIYILNHCQIRYFGGVTTEFSLF